MEIKCFLVIIVLVSLFKSGHCLQCYSCNVSSSTIDKDGCSGIGSLKHCASGSVCLAATYEINSGIVKTYTTMQSCFPDMAGAECENFIKTQKNLHTSAVLAQNKTYCYVCHSDNCNKEAHPKVIVNKVVNNGGMGSYSKQGVAALFFSTVIFRLVLV